VAVTNSNEPIDRSLTHSIRLPDLVRVGSDSDGGYVVPRSVLSACDGILGLGIHADWSFERDARALSAAGRAHLYDATTTIPWLVSRMPMGVLRILGGALSAQPRRVRDGLNRLAAPFRYRRFFRGDVRHYPQMIGHRTEPGWVDPATAIARLREAGATRILVKMDIEGGEYEVLPRIGEWGEQVDLLLVEFHGIQDDPARFNALMRELSRLFVPVHLHGNNSQPLTADGFPGMVEITFLARRLMPRGARAAPFDYPIPALDRRSSLRGPELSFTA
jgi:hypothetical protein